MARRFDNTKIRLDKGYKTIQGFLHVPAYLTRTGVFKYRTKEGGIRRELRHPDDVFREDSLVTLRLAPTTYEHPPEMVTSENVKKYGTGWVSDRVHPEGSHVAGFLVLADKKAIDSAEAGVVELSCGYDTDLVQESGSYNGEEYDFRQTNIRYNHVAQLERGRAGPTVRLHLDAEDASMVENEDPKEDSDMKKKVVIDGKEYEVDAAVADAFEASRKKNDEFEAANKKSKEKMDSMVERVDHDKVVKELEAEKQKSKTATDDKDKTQARLDSIEADLKNQKERLTQDSIDKMADERARVKEVARKVLGPDAKLDGANAELKKQVILKKYPETKLDGASEVYINGRFDAIVDHMGTTESKAEEYGKRLTVERKDSDLDSAAAKKRQDEAAKKQSEGKTSASW